MTPKRSGEQNLLAVNEARCHIEERCKMKVSIGLPKRYGFEDSWRCRANQQDRNQTF